MTAPALEVAGLTVTYGRRVAVRDVDLQIAPGERLGIIGPNGAGKSSVLKAAVGLVSPRTGSVRIKGAPAARRRHMAAYLPQRQQIDWDYPAQVRDIVAMGRYPHAGATGRLRTLDRQQIDDAMNRVGIASLARVRISELSGGQQQRVFLARAFAQQAGVLLLDEPYVGVDAVTSDLLDTWLAEAASDGMAVVVVDHDLAGVRRRYDRVALLNGELVACGQPAAVLEPAHLQAAYGQGAVVIEAESGDE